MEAKKYIRILKQKVERNPLEHKSIKRDKKLELTLEQLDAYNKVSNCIDKEQYQEFLLYGVTGSRKNRNLFTIN